MEHFFLFAFFTVSVSIGHAIGQHFTRREMQGKVKSGFVFWFDGDDTFIFKTTRIDPTCYRLTPIETEEGK